MQNSLSLHVAELAGVPSTVRARHAGPSVCPAHGFSYGNYYQEINGSIVPKCGANTEETLTFTTQLSTKFCNSPILPKFNYATNPSQPFAFN
jgi:hypothetical protein